MGLVLADHTNVFDGENTYILCKGGIRINPAGLTSPYLTQNEDKKYRDACKSFEHSDSKVDFTSYAPNYELIEVRRAADWYPLIVYTLVSAFSIFIIFEILRRVFYYVVLGSMWPARYAKNL